jgi:protein-glutamine gamma-glutamyltransferase
MRREALLAAGAGLLIAFSWLRLEEPEEGGRVLLVLALALAPVLLPRRAWRLLAAVPALLLGAAAAFDVSPLGAPHSFLAAVLDRADAGLRAFYSVSLPFDPQQRPAMHGLVVLAICTFSLAVGLAIRERRAIAASLLIAAGCGWPATLRPGDGELAQGAIILTASLVVLAALRGSPLGGRGPVLAGGAAVVLAAVLAASTPAVARDEVFDGWRTWSPYSRHDPGVGVDYVWNSTYTGIEFPDEPTKLLEIAAPRHPRYWRATTLDVYRNGRWLESLGLTAPIERAGRVELIADSDLPDEARERSRWFEQQVRVSGLRDTHLVGASVPTAYDIDDDEGVAYSAGGVAEIDGGLRQGFEYTVWSYSPGPRPRRLAASRPDYDPELKPAYLEVERDVYVPPFGTPGRHARVLELIRTVPGLSEYEPLYRIARRVGGESTPYGAVVSLETWLRTNPQFLYEEQPPRWPPGVPPLVDFVVRTKQGYCQQYAGAMALMLRYLGIPARVGAGFTSGSYDAEEGTWTVTDRNAHTWVEVWFRGYGWLPFDPTPGRGRLAGPYTSASLGFRGREALAALGRESAGLGRDGREALRDQLDRLRARERADEGAAAFHEAESSDGRGGDTVGVLLLTAVAATAAIAAAKFVRRRLRYLGGGARRIAGACRAELADFVGDQRVDVRPAATLTELGSTVRAALAVDTSHFVRAAAAARFGPEPSAEDAARAARRELRALKREIRRRLSTRRRLRGLVSLRSLRPTG